MGYCGMYALSAYFLGPLWRGQPPVEHRKISIGIIDWMSSLDNLLVQHLFVAFMGFANLKSTNLMHPTHVASAKSSARTGPVHRTVHRDRPLTVHPNGLH